MTTEQILRGVEKMPRKLALLVGAAMLASAGLGYAAGHNDHGTIVAWDAVE